MTVWREQILRFLQQGRTDGSVQTTAEDDVIAEQLLAILNGTQIAGVLTPDATTPKRQRQMVDAFLDSLAR